MNLKLDNLTGAQVLGLTGWAEARSIFVPHLGWRPAPLEVMQAVMCTVPNRLHADPKRFGATIKDVCLMPRQYSCWNPGGSNHASLMYQVLEVQSQAHEDPVLLECIDLATKIIAGTVPDNTNGATHYYSPVSMVPSGAIPRWALQVEPCAKVGDHLFFKGV